MKENLTILKLIEEAKTFCENESKFQNAELFGITDGKAVGTYIEHKFREYLLEKYTLQIGSSASGIDLPSVETDIKVTSIKQPQSSCPFKDSKQKIFGLGYNLLVFVYDKNDNAITKKATLNFVSCSFVAKERTGDFGTTRMIRQMLEDEATKEDIAAYLEDIRIPSDFPTLLQIAEEVLENPPEQGYLTISNALQWRLQYNRIVLLKDKVQGITKVIDKNIA